jgi:hypothetical protein
MVNETKLHYGKTQNYINKLLPISSSVGEKLKKKVEA